MMKEILGEQYQYLIRYFEAMKDLDTNPKACINESVFDVLFPPKLCSTIFGSPDTDRSSRNQRKMDMAVIRHAYHLWKDRNYYDISPALTEKLKEAEFKNIDTFFIRVPSRSMYLSLPKGNGLNIYNQQSGLHEIEAIYITYDAFPEPKNLMLKKDGEILKDATKHIHMLVWGEQKTYLGDALMFFDLIFQDGKVSESIEQNRHILDNKEMWEYIVEVFNFVSKVLLYVNCSNVTLQKIAGINLDEKIKGLKNPAKIRKTLQKYSKISPQAHHYLDVVIDHSHESSGSVGGSTAKSGSKSLEKVRPHFKTQWYGTNKSKSKIIWVESYLRGDGVEFFKEKNIYTVR